MSAASCSRCALFAMVCFLCRLFILLWGQSRNILVISLIFSNQHNCLWRHPCACRIVTYACVGIPRLCQWSLRLVTSGTIWPPFAVRSAQADRPWDFVLENWHVLSRMVAVQHSVISAIFLFQLKSKWSSTGTKQGSAQSTSAINGTWPFSRIKSS